MMQRPTLGSLGPRDVVKALATLWLFGICLRITVLAIPPVVPLIHQSFHLSQAAVGALTSLPVLLFSFAALPGSLLVARYGAAHVLTVGILVTGLAGALRGAAFDTNLLFAATFVMGVGIAIMQPALPALVRDWVPQRIALGTATYSNALLVGEALSASLTIPLVLPAVGNSWRRSLVAWSLPVLAIGLLSACVSRREPVAHRRSGPPRRWWPDWRDPLTWKLGLIAGFASSLYFALNAFLPDYLRWRGRPDLLAAALSALNWVQIPASILMLVYAERLTLRRWPFVALGTASGVSVAGLLVTPDAWIVVWAGVIGFCNAFMLILTMALPPLLTRSEDVHRLSAAMFAIGYLCAFVIPIIGGVIWDATAFAPAAFGPIVLFAGLAVMLAARLEFKPGSDPVFR
jgi:CP family cyanate transporter-like MFS transporter